MDQKLPPTQETDPIRDQNLPGHPPPTRSRQGGRKAQTPPEIPSLTGVLSKTVRHFFRELPLWLREMKDPRDPDTLHYRLDHLVWCGILMYQMHLGSRNQLKWERLGPAFASNLRHLSGGDEAEVAHPDTLAALLERMDVGDWEIFLARFARRLIRMKALDDFRLEGHFMVAVDGTGFLSFDHPHCEHCLRAEHASGKVTYRHPVLVASLVAAEGLVIPLAVEFLENPSQPYDKQDCELKGFHRLAQRLKVLFPQTPFCLLLDALYACESVMDLCQDYQWKYLITFKESDMPALWKEATSLRDLCPEQVRNGKSAQGHDLRVQWVNDLHHGKYPLGALFQTQTLKDQTTSFFAHLTNWPLNADNAESLASGGRQRWKIENEGFNVLKNGGFDLEHAYSRNLTAAKIYFHLMLIAHLFQQLMVKGSLFTCFSKQVGTMKNFAKRLAQAFANLLGPPDEPPPGQIRFCSA